MFWSLATCSVFHTLLKSDSLIFRQLSSCKHNLFLHQQHFRCPIYFLPTLPLLHLFLHQPGLIQLCLCFSWAVPVSFHAPLNVTFHRSYFFFNHFFFTQPHFMPVHAISRSTHRSSRPSRHFHCLQTSGRTTIAARDIYKYKYKYFHGCKDNQTSSNVLKFCQFSCFIYSQSI